tara:strand:- start:1399 stop:1602 length:204 start_codon:yes stop_codon:yes gene_type:complete
MPGTSDAVAITTEDVQFDTVSPKEAFKVVQDAMAAGQEAFDAVPMDIKKKAKEYSEGSLVETDYSSY